MKSLNDHSTKPQEASPGKLWKPVATWEAATTVTRSWDWVLRRRKGFIYITKKLLRNRLSVIGLVLLIVSIAVAIGAPWLAPPKNPSQPYQVWRESFKATPAPPDAAHPFDTSGGSYDVYYGIIWGTRTAFRVGLTVTISIVLIGLIIGALSAYYGGVIDNVIMRIVDIFLAIPALLGAIVLTTFLGKGLDSVIIAFIVFGWPFYARLMRGEVLRVKEMDYVTAARAAGAETLRVVFRHVLPNAIFVVFAVGTLDIGSQMIGVAALSFLGLGSPEGYADWGQMISFGRAWLVGSAVNPLQYWWTIAFPGAALLLFVLSFALLGDAFRDILDPRLRGAGR